MGAEIEMNRRVKRMLLLALLALALGLSGCYVPADQINNGQDGINPGGDNVPFVTVVVTSPPTPVVTPAPTPQPGAATTAPSSGWSGWGFSAFSGVTELKCRAMSASSRSGASAL